MKVKATICRCEAYPFPHRYLGGKCIGYDPDRPDEEAADRWLLRLMERGHRVLDAFKDGWDGKEHE